MSQSELARRLNKNIGGNYLPTTVGKMLSGERKITFDEVIAIGSILDAQLPISKNGPSRVRLVGYVGAGAVAVLFEEGQGTSDFVDAPPESSATMVAVEVKGNSMFPVAKDGWLLYYDRRNETPAEDLIGEMCVVGLDDGRVLVKELAHGRERGVFDLISHNAEPIQGVRIEWLAPVVWIRRRPPAMKGIRP